jgi:hypothetical protein
MGNPKAMKAIRDYEAGKAKLKDVSCLDDVRWCTTSSSVG